MNEASITSTDSFKLRAQRSEQARIAVTAAVFALLLAGVSIRHLSGGVVIASRPVFLWSMVVLAVAIGYELITLGEVRRFTRSGRIVQGWRWKANTVFELAVPVALLSIQYAWSPLGEFAALSAAPVLVFPLVVLLSVLRLKPLFTLWTGVGGALAHWALVAHLITTTNVPLEQIPALAPYGSLIALTGIVGAMVAQAARSYVVDTVEEATQRERESQHLKNIKRDLAVARDIQSGLLPSEPPKLAGFDIAGMNRPADETGGDYYDWQELPDGRLLVVMADVTGHGIGPALVMAVCRAYARASAPVHADPAALLGRLNKLLYLDLHGGRFITLATVFLREDGGAELISAGHGPTVLFVASDKNVSQFPADGAPLAIDPGQEYGPVRRMAMKQGDLLVLLTDGVYEWRNTVGEQFGLTRLSQAVVDAAQKPAAGIVESIHRAVQDFAGGAAQLDDVTLVVIKRIA